jgi:hypothetical protein
MTPFLAIIYPVPAHQAAPIIAALGLIPPDLDLPLPMSAAPLPTGSPLTKTQGEIVAALTKKPPLNERQIAILEVYWDAHRRGEPALSIEAAATRLAQKIAVDPARGEDFVKGALRSFGKRLFATLSGIPPLKIGRDAMGDGVADAIPLLAMLSIEKGPSGEARHKLTPDGAVAIAAALALNVKGEAASSSVTGADDPDEIVTLAVTRLAAALVMRVARTRGIGTDDAVKLMASLAGAG